MSAALAGFQEALARALLHDGPSGDARVDAMRRQPGFAVYRNTVLAGCVDALVANFPAVARLVGGTWLRAAAAVYARAQPPTDPRLGLYGAGFAAFLADFPPAAALPYLPGVARLDRCWSEAHVAADEPPLDPAAVAALDPDAMRRTGLRPHTSARWAWFDALPVATIWSRNRRGEGPGDEDEIAWHGEGMLVLRPHLEVRWRPLARADTAFLDACAAGGSLATAAAAALAADPQADLASTMHALLDMGAFAECMPVPSPDEDPRR